MTKGPSLYGGVLSGTSLDGVDALLLEVDGDDPAQLRWEVRGFFTEPYAPDERDGIRRTIAEGGARDLALLGGEISRAFARAFRRVLERAGVSRADVTAVGSHGQTVWHEPPADDWPGATLQIGNPSVLAEELGIPVVSDFRSRDMAAGGHGAPLVPWCDWALLRRPGTGLALQNLGGMGNVTFLPRDGSLDGVRGFDTGPGVALVDGAARLASDGNDRWDEDGRRSSRGRVRPDLLDELLADAFFKQPPPRSTGRERFGDARLEQIVERAAPTSDADWDDLLATLVELTARSVAGACRDHLPAGAVDTMVLTGGGARNPALVKRIAEAVSPLPVETGAAALGIDPDAREAAAFALLAWAHLHGVPANVPAVTGARGARVLGSLTPGMCGPA